MPVFFPGLSLAQRHFPGHARFVISQKSIDVAIDQKFRRCVKFALIRAPKGIVGFRQAIQVCVVEGHLEISERKVRVDLDCFRAFFERPLVVAKSGVNHRR